MTARRAPRRPPIPPHWVGVRKFYQYFCRSFGEALVELRPEHLATHALVIGSTGSGKSNFLHHMLAGDLMRGHSVVVLDGRGDIALAGVELAARAGVSPDLVRFINLREKRNPLGFNPLAGQGEPYFRALQLVDAVAAESESWGVQLAETFRYAALLLAEVGGSLTELEGLFYNPSTRRALISRASAESVRAFWQRYDALSPDRQAALAGPVLNKCSILLATEGLKRMFGHPSPIDLAAHLATPGSVTLISLAVDELHAAGWMVGSLFLSSVCREIFSQVDVPESRRNPVRLYVDEFENFSGPAFESILAEGRRFNLSAVLAHQTLAQLAPKMRAIILGNVGLKVIFRSSHGDADILNRDLTGVKGGFDIASLRTGEAVLWRRGELPFEIEVNAPLIQDVGQVSPLAREFLAELAVQAGVFPEIATDPASSTEAEAMESPERRRSNGRSSDLGDWLS